MLMILLGGWAFVIRINYLIGCIYFCERIYQTELPGLYLAILFGN